jgi:hypothetical protein
MLFMLRCSCFSRSSSRPGPSSGAGDPRPGPLTAPGSSVLPRGLHGLRDPRKRLHGSRSRDRRTGRASRGPSHGFREGSMIFSAGVVVVRREEGRWKHLFLRAYRNRDFPKGVVEPGEDPLDAAKRRRPRRRGLRTCAFMGSRLAGNSASADPLRRSGSSSRMRSIGSRV